MKKGVWGLIVCVLLGLAVLAKEANAGTTTITFDEFAPLNGTCLTGQYAYLGVNFVPTLTGACSASTYNTPWQGISSGTNGQAIMASPGVVEGNGQKSAGFVMEFDYPVNSLKLDFTVGAGTTTTENLTYFMINGNTPVGLGNATLPAPDQWKTLNFAPTGGSKFTAIVVYVPAGNTTAGLKEIFAGFDNLIIDAENCFPTKADFAVLQTTVYVNAPVEFADASAADASSWEWNFGDGETSIEQDTAHAYGVAGKYTVSLTVMNDCGSSDTITKTNYITVEKVPEIPPTADFNASPAKGAVPLTVRFSDYSEYATSWQWDFGDGTTSSLKNPTHDYSEVGLFTVSLIVTNPFGTDSVTKEDYIEVTADAYRLYFPYVITNDQRSTKLVIVNTNQKNNVAGNLYYYDSTGAEVSPNDFLVVTSNGRVEIDITDTNVHYVIFVSRTFGARGYAEFSVDNTARAAIPAIDAPSDGVLYMHHLVSQEKWESRIALLNTTDATKGIIFDIQGAQNRLIPIPPRGQYVTTIAELFKAYKPSEIRSGIILNAEGVLGVEIFEGIDQMYGIVLDDSLTQTIYYPHVADANEWDTGIVLYNPWTATCEVTVTAYGADGTELGSDTYEMGVLQKLAGCWRRMGFVDDAAWLRADATLPITGFESLFRRTDPEAGGINTVGLTAKKGVFAKIQENGWTEVVLVNIGDEPAAVTFTAFDNDGNVIAVENASIGAKEKLIDMVENLFSTDIRAATYVSYSSDQELSACEVNGSADNRALDALPAL